MTIPYLDNLGLKRFARGIINKTKTETAPMMVPIGTVIDYAGQTVPSGYLECDGSAVSRTDYAELFAVLGTAWGSGNGSTTFNLPNLSGKTTIGVSSSHSFATTGGSETVTLTSAQSGVPAHTHSVGAHKHTIPAHGHSNTIKATTPKFTHSITQPVFKLPDHKHQLGIRSANFSGSYAATHTTAWEKHSNDMRTSDNPSSLPNCTRSTDVAVGDHAATACTMSGSVTDKAAFDTNNSTAFDSGSNTAANASESHNNMQPYATIRKIVRAF